MMSLPERLKQTRKEQGISQAQIATFVGISQCSIALIEDGTTKRSVHIPKIAEFLGVTASWLDYGEGVKDNDGIAFQSEEKLLISDFRRLNNIDKEVVIRIVNALNSKAYGNKSKA